MSESSSRNSMTLPATHSEEDDSLSLHDLVDVAMAGKAIVVGFTIAGAILGIVYGQVVTPVFESQALLQVEDRRRGMPLDHLAGGDFDGETRPAETEIEILRSRLVLGQVVDEMSLRLVVEPVRVPLIGAYLARRHDSDRPAEAAFGSSSYAWGGERVMIERFELEGSAEQSSFHLEAGEGGAYSLYTKTGEKLLVGEVGALAEFEYGEREVRAGAILVSELDARPGTQFRIRKRTWLGAIRSVRGRLSIREQGMGTGILELTLRGEDPLRVKEVLAAITDTYMSQHVERRSAEARQSIEFLDETLPEIRTDLERAEDAFNEFRRRHRAVDLGADAENLLAQIVGIETDLVELELRRVEEGRRFTSEHPRIRTLGRQERELRAKKAELERRVDALPSREQEALRLRREVEVATELYTGLLNMSQELRVAEAGTIGHVRVLDAAVRPESPVEPRRGVLAAMSTVLGLLGGFGWVFVRHALQRTVQDPGALERAIGVPLVSVIPHSPSERRADRRAKRRGRTSPLLAAEHPDDPAVEELRSLRTSLHLGLLEERGRVLAVASPRGDSGASFVCLNAAYVFAEAGKRVLIIDADMRHGLLHRSFGCERSPGLSEVLARQVPLGETVQRLRKERTGRAEPSDEGEEERSGGLYLLPTGTLPPNPSELLMGDALEELLQEAQTLFDVVIMDTPPILPFTDASIAAAHAGALLMLVRAGHSEIKDVEAAVRRIHQNELPLAGLLCNDRV